ncbi:helix-turn-helix domain-containing protein [Massilia sp. DWR3-1-1]|uniref:helix-turn-helix domain-containing protein n=1 Tax=Massilia sp. DWR3-1-1 TaxID=2804559 RepID=UPI003CFA621B
MSSERAEQAGTSTGASVADSSAAPGQILAAQRQAMGWTVEQVADQLKLAVRQVVAIEAGDSAALPGPAVVRGFVRAYAKIVRLDPIPLVARISLDTPGPSDATHTHLRHNKPASFSEVRFPSHGRRAALPIVPILAVLVLVGAAAAAWHFGLLAKLTGRADSATASNMVAAPIGAASVASTPLVVTVPQGSTASLPASLQNPSVPLISVPPPSAVAPDSPSAGVAPVVAATPAAAAAPVVAGANALVVTVREDSWLQIKRAKGAPLISRLVKAGSTETFDISEPVTMVVGKPAGVSATLRGATVELPANKGSAARVELK